MRKFYSITLINKCLFALVSLFTGLCLSFNVSAQSSLALPVSFRGAELFADILGGGKIVVHLEKYYDCGREQASETEHISLFERGTMFSKEGITLNKVSDTIQQNRNLQVPGHSDWGCIKVITYAAEVPVGVGRSDYDITWGYQGLSSEIANLGNSKDRGFSLSIHASYNDKGIENSMPSLLSLPSFIMMAGKNVSGKIEFGDKDRDIVTVSACTPFSLEPVNPDTRVLREVPSPIPAEQSVLTARGPFKEIALNGKNPIGGKVFSIAPEGMFNYQPDNKNGKYLAAILITETRENKVLSEHQCVFVIDVK